MPPKICVIGAGSASFGLSTLSTLLCTPELRGSEIRLVDIRGEELALIAKLGGRLNSEWKSECVIKHSTDRCQMLEGCDFVIISVAIDRWERWKSDYEIGLRHGILHYAENGGPGAFAHTTRNIHLIKPILDDIKALCPNAYVLNFTNPVPRITHAARRHAGLNAYGICHQVNHGYLIAGYLLADILGAEAPSHITSMRDPETKMALRPSYKAAKERIDIKAAGVNHFTWLLSITENGTGRDLKPLLKERLLAAEDAFEPLTRRLLKTFDVIPITGDTHLSEYLGYTHNGARGSWERNHMSAFNFDRAAKFGEKRWDRIRAMAEGTQEVDSLRESDSERVEAVISAIVANTNAYELALNMPNRGNIQGLQEGGIIEVPAIVNAAGIHGLAVGPLPPAVTEFCRREITIAQMVVEAALTGDRAFAVQAMALCPMVDDLDLAEQMVADYIRENEGYFPDFE